MGVRFYRKPTFSYNCSQVGHSRIRKRQSRDPRCVKADVLARLRPAFMCFSVFLFSLSNYGAAYAQSAPTPNRALPTAAPSPQATHAPEVVHDLLLSTLLLGALPSATGHKIVYVIGQPASDTTTRVLTVAAAALQNASKEVWVIPRAEWSVNDLQTQCTKANFDNGFIGAVVFEAVLGVSGTENYFVLQRGWSKVHASAEVWSCTPIANPMDKGPTAVATIIAKPIDVNGFGNLNGATLYPEAGLATYWTVNPSNVPKSIALGTAVLGGAAAATIPNVNTGITLDKAASSFGLGLTASLHESFCKLINPLPCQALP